MIPDTATGHPVPVTPDAAEREAATRAALAAHKDTCAPCGDVMPCSRRRDLTAAWRRALRDASLNHAPLNRAPAGGQITTTPATG